MLSHQHRFHGHGSLKYLFKNGKTARNRVLAFRYIENKNRVHTRVSVVVGKKVSKSAVKRNRIRRRVFEILRTNWDQVPEGYDISVTVFSIELLTMTHDELKRNVLGVLRSIR